MTGILTCVRRLDRDKYHLKNLSDFFAAMGREDTTKEVSVNSFLRITEKLHNLETVCLPLTIRLGETVGEEKADDTIVFEKLTGYKMGFPAEKRNGRRCWMQPGTLWHRCTKKVLFMWIFTCQIS